ncbi:lipid-A-disaccharide synthase [Gangjinia marincola]|uniref:Lipid-A-disaccharide synthase n=1 Tax=Gangjinia marincola TaxID=578463 RepID=A0ABP3XSZ0_9FLAO
MKYYLIAGEASGDLHGANLMKQLKEVDPAADFRYWGGDLMEEQGGILVNHYKTRAFMGFIEVVLNIRTALRNIAACKKDIAAYRPDAIIFIDYPGFNFPVMKWAKKQGFSTHFYISPQIWAWKENRIKAIKRDVDHMYVILPFEKTFYEKKHDYQVHFVGHPLLDAIENRTILSKETFKAQHKLDDRPIIALLPGSRKQEIAKMLEVMLQMKDIFKDYQFVVAGAPSQDREYYEQFFSSEEITLIQNQTYDLLDHAHAALVTSGTATLETALFNVPQVVCYKGSFLSYQIAKRIINLSYISLVNLIMDREVVKELIQTGFNPVQLEQELTLILSGIRRAAILDDYTTLREKLGGAGASATTAQLIYNSTVKE